ncbi:MAG: hypothetical protein OEZ36_11840 [Spirochaetota bacterium]|nr:hypothetical protein [Spirochaetota bacterium]
MAYDSKKLLYLKTRFSSEAKGIFGVFFIMFDPGRNSYEKFDLLASHFREFLNSLPGESQWTGLNWQTLEEAIVKARFNSQFTDNITRDLSRTMEKTLNTAEIEMILPLVLKQDIENLDKTFHEIFRKSIGDIPITFTFAFEETTLKDVKEQEEKRKKDYQTEQQELKEQLEDFEAKKHELPENSALVDCFFVLSPVKGVIISDLKAGHQIFVKIDIANNKGQYFANLVNASSEGEMLPIPSVVEKVGKGPTGEYFVITKIQDGIYGRITETEPVKIRLFDPEKDKDLLRKPVDMPDTKEILSDIDVKESMDKSSKLSLVVIGIIILAVIVILLLNYVV